MLYNTYLYHMHLDFSKLIDVYEELFFRCTAFTFSSQSMMGYLGKEEEFSGKIHLAIEWSGWSCSVYFKQWI